MLAGFTTLVRLAFASPLLDIVESRGTEGGQDSSVPGGCAPHPPPRGPSLPPLPHLEEIVFEHCELVLPTAFLSTRPHTSAFPGGEGFIPAGILRCSGGGSSKRPRPPPSPPAATAATTGETASKGLWSSAADLRQALADLCLWQYGDGSTCSTAGQTQQQASSLPRLRRVVFCRLAARAGCIPADLGECNAPSTEDGGNYRPGEQSAPSAAGRHHYNKQLSPRQQQLSRQSAAKLPSPRPRSAGSSDVLMSEAIEPFAFALHAPQWDASSSDVMMQPLAAKDSQRADDSHSLLFGPYAFEMLKASGAAAAAAGLSPMAETERAPAPPAGPPLSPSASTARAHAPPAGPPHPASTSVPAPATSWRLSVGVRTSFCRAVDRIDVVATVV